jgi:hypothetical protein
MQAKRLIANLQGIDDPLRNPANVKKHLKLVLELCKTGRLLTQRIETAA